MAATGLQDLGLAERKNATEGIPFSEEGGDGSPGVFVS